MKKILLFTLVFLAVLNCKENYSPVPFYKIANQNIIQNGKYPVELIFLDENKKVLEHLDAYSDAWIIIKNSKFANLETGEWIIPSKNTTDPIGKLQVIELPKIKYFKLRTYQTLR